MDLALVLDTSEENRVAPLMPWLDAGEHTSW
jgi:hypothetical protein